MKASDDILKWIIIGSSVIVVLVIGWAVITQTAPSTNQTPGKDIVDKSKQMEDLGRDHITDITDTTYNSNPPTSGPHFAIWAQRGTYDRVISDGYLIHSLEHGYVVLSYNCDPSASASAVMPEGFYKMNTEQTGSMSAFTPKNAPEKFMELPDAFKTDACKQLTTRLSEFLASHHRVIIVPRPQMKSRIALAAWTRIDTMDSFDKDRINGFITKYHNQGPEKTVE